MKRIKDTDYLAISARIRAMENTLLTRERMERILEARTEEEAVKILEECGYSGLEDATPEGIDASLLAARQEMLRDLGDSLPDQGFLDIFRLKYDYHNVKTLLKARLAGVKAEHILMNLGRISPQELTAAMESGDLDALPGLLGPAAAEAKEILDTTRDGQLSDIALDRWYYREMEAIAKASGSGFLEGFVRLQIDAANLRALVRTIRMGKNADFLKLVLLEGGHIAAEELLSVSAEKGSGLAELYAPTVFRAAAESGAAALGGGPLTEFEKRCDDAVSTYLSDARFVPFGEQAVLAYLAARETEYTNLHILLLGRSMGLDPEVIRSRLRESCV